MVFAEAPGSVTALRREDDEGIVDVELRAMNDLGEHISGTATIGLPLEVSR